MNKQMVNKLIKLLGGYTWDQFTYLIKQEKQKMKRELKMATYNGKEELVREIIRSKAKRKIVVWEDHDARYQLIAKKIK